MLQIIFGLWVLMSLVMATAILHETDKKYAEQPETYIEPETKSGSDIMLIRVIEKDGSQHWEWYDKRTGEMTKPLTPSSTSSSVEQAS